jgi:hypothetical protein
MRNHRAAIPVAQVLVVHPAVLLHPLQPVVRHLRVRVQIVQVLAAHLHLRHPHRDHLVQIANVAVKIFRRAVVHQIAVVQRVKSRKVVKSVIHAGFVPSL